MLSTQSLWFLAAGYAVILAFFIITRLLRRTEAARSFRGGVYDRGNMILIGSATGVGLWVPVIADVLGLGIFSVGLAVGLAALALMLLGSDSGPGRRSP